MPMHPKSDPRYFVVIRPLPIPSQKGLKVQARSNTIYNCWDVTREQVFRENYHRRIKQLTQQGYFTPSWKPYQDFGEPLYLDPRKLTLYGLGQLPLGFFREDVGPEEVAEPVEPVSAKKRKPKEPEKKLLPFRNLEKDLRTLHKDLAHTRYLINSVKIGRGYFHMLRRETLERQEALRLEEWKEEERLRTDCQPPQYPSSSSSDEDSGDEELTDFFLTECPFLRETEKKKKKKIVRPFTPVYNGLLSEKHPEAHFDSIFRQLCALNWFLEALTLDSGCSMKPVITCWHPRHYGGAKSSLKVIAKEKTVKSRWEHFLLHAKGRKYTQKGQYRGKKVPKRSSTMSISSPHSKTTLTSTSSLSPIYDEAAQPPSDSAKEGEEMESVFSKQTREEEEPMCYQLQTLLQMVHEDVAKNFSKENMFWNLTHGCSHTILSRRELESEFSFGQKGKSSVSSSKEEKTSTGAAKEETSGEQRPKSSMTVTVREDKTVTATYSDDETDGKPQSLFLKRKEQTFQNMKDIFHEVAHESAFRLHDQLDILERRREEKSTRKYLCLSRITKFRKDLERMRQSMVGTEPEQDAESENWFSTLLARIPDDVKRDRRTQKVLKKLERFARNPDLRIRPPTFLKVLGELRIWEICSPDICAAVEVIEDVAGLELLPYHLETRTPELAKEPPKAKGGKGGLGQERNAISRLSQVPLGA
ncbi:coiled-coil domain-containing protein 60 isoform X1 [Zootoca vivipara]|uniref:coiled-coil domain-containing protein 60 isoform X1 n=1 Tax=Zootoca vivipara TaxID=8524 RepID=UPI00293BC784|nr:coiled-coil domain-containing protein 60 isoform X1 [Zootoca vivipara]